MFLLFKNYALVEDIHPLITSNKSNFFLWNTNNTNGNDVNKQNAHTHTHTTQSENQHWKEITPNFTNPSLFKGKIWPPKFVKISKTETNLCSNYVRPFLTCSFNPHLFCFYPAMFESRINRSRVSCEFGNTLSSFVSVSTR